MDLTNAGNAVTETTNANTADVHIQLKYHRGDVLEMITVVTTSKMTCIGVPMYTKSGIGSSRKNKKNEKYLNKNERTCKFTNHALILTFSLVTSWPIYQEVGCVSEWRHKACRRCKHEVVRHQ